MKSIARKKKWKRKCGSSSREFLCFMGGDQWLSSPFTHHKNNRLDAEILNDKKSTEKNLPLVKRSARWNCRTNLRNQLANNKKMVSTMSGDGWRQDVIKVCAKFLLFVGFVIDLERNFLCSKQNKTKSAIGTQQHAIANHTKIFLRRTSSGHMLMWLWWWSHCLRWRFSPCCWKQPLAMETGSRHQNQDSLSWAWDSPWLLFASPSACTSHQGSAERCGQAPFHPMAMDLTTRTM